MRRLAARLAARRHAGSYAGARLPFNELQPGDLSAFAEILGSDAVVTDADALQQHNTDWLGQYRGESRVAIFPRNTAAVSAVLRHCAARRLAVVPQGGNTGLAGGGVPVFDEVVLCMSRMNRVHSVDVDAGVAVAEAGVTLGQLDDALRPHGLTVPLDLGSRARCQLGGNVATCAAGLRLIRFGSLRANVLGLEVVLSDGRVLDLMKTVRKDATGGCLKQLFIGSEGTLGITTKVALLAPQRPAFSSIAWLACPSFDAVLACTRRARAMLGEQLSACEFQDATALQLVLDQHPEAAAPTPDCASAARFYMLVECGGSSGTHVRASLQAFLAAGVAAGDAVPAASLLPDAEAAAGIWRLRTGIAESFVRRGGHTFKYDLSVSQREMYSLVEAVRERLRGTGALVAGYGHVGDGNIHINVGCSPGATQEEIEAAAALLEPFVYERVGELCGSVSAEHGIGQMKLDALRFGKSSEAIDVMHALKASLDPLGILNPYKVLPTQRTLNGFKQTRASPQIRALLCWDR